jgi:hypothetical protein
MYLFAACKALFLSLGELASPWEVYSLGELGELVAGLLDG